MKKKYIFFFSLLAAIVLIITFAIGCSNSEGDIYNPITPSSSPSILPSISPTSSPSQSPSPSPTSSPADVTPPTVTNVDPANEATAVEPTASVTITFSEDMDESTINDTNVQITGPSGQANGTLAKEGGLAVFKFTPTFGYNDSVVYTVKVTTGVKDLSGNQMASDFTSTFTVRAREWGTAQLIENDDSGNVNGPQVAMDPSGNAVAVWYLYDGTRYNIWSNRYTFGSGWGTAELIETDNVGTAVSPQVAVDLSGNAVAVWQQTNGTRFSIWSNRYTAGSGWGTAELIETDDTGNAVSAQVAVDPSGNALAVWQQYDGSRNNIWSNRYTSGSGWGTAELIETDDTGNAFGPQIVIDPSGNAIAVWSQNDGTRNNVWSNRYTFGSSWGTAELIETDNAGNTYSPQVTVDQSGNAIALWYQSDGTRTNIWSNRYTSGSGWGTAEIIETDNAGDAKEPQIDVDQTGNAVAVWYQYDGTRYNIWSKLYTLGTGWGTAEMIEADNAGDAAYPQVAVDPSGNAIAVWHQNDGTRTNIWANLFR